MLENGIYEIIEKAATEDFNRPKGQPKGLLLTQFAEDANECGATFADWYKKIVIRQRQRRQRQVQRQRQTQRQRVNMTMTENAVA